MFALVNVGEITQVEWTDQDDVVETQTAILAFVNGETTDPVSEEVSPNHVVALDDVGSVGNLRTTGNGQLGELPAAANPITGAAASPGTAVPVSLTVQSSGRAVMSVTAGCSDRTCYDATLELTSGSNANSILELVSHVSELVADAQGDFTIENRVRSTFKTFNMGTPDIPAVGQLQSLWTSQNPTLRTSYQTEGHDEYKIMQLVDQGLYGDLAISGSGNVVGASEGAVQIGSTGRTQPSYLSAVSGQEEDAVVMVQSGPGLQPSLTLQDSSESGSATFTIRNDGTFATPRMQIVDKDQSSLLEVRAVCTSSQCVGNLHATGDVVIGSPDSTPSGWGTGDRYLRVAAGQAASLAVEAGLEGDAAIRIGSGEDNIARVRLGPRVNATADDATDNGGFEIARKTSWLDAEGNEQSGNALSINFMGAPMFTVTDADKSASQSVGNLAVSGDVTIGGQDLESRSVVVASMARASLSVQSGDFENAEIGLIAGNAATALVTLETMSAPETEGDPDVSNVFKLMLDGSIPGDPMLKIGDADSDFIVVTDAGVVGNLEVTGNGLFGSAMSPFRDQIQAGAKLPTDLTIRAPNGAMLDVIGAERASLHITSGFDAPSQFSLSARPELSQGGHMTSSYLWTNRGYTLTVQDSAHTNVTVLALSDMGGVGKLEFAGDATFSTIGQTETVLSNGQLVAVPIDATVTVASGSMAEVSVEAGIGSPAELTLQSGANRASKLTLRSRKDTPVGNTIQTTYKDFAFVNAGSAAQSQFQITDGVNPILMVEKNNGEPLVTLPGTLVCENLVSSSRTVLGSDVTSEIVINGHIKSPTLNFDGNDDGIMLSVRFEDPQSSTTITIPDESGTIMTTATAFSQLEGVDSLVAGQIAQGFGSITTSKNIMTTAAVSSAGTVRAESGFHANAAITIGDATEDDVHFRGVVQTNIRLSGFGCDAVGGCAKGIRFHASQEQLASSANIGLGTPGKQTKLRGQFLDGSPLGERHIVIPDVPMGGMLHVNNNPMEIRDASNVHQVAFPSGATVGVIRSYSGFEPNSGILAGESDIINLVNPRIKPTSTVIATISDPGDPQLGGWVIVTAVKVAQTAGQCTVKVTNVHPTRAMNGQYMVGFVVFNPS